MAFKKILIIYTGLLFLTMACQEEKTLEHTLNEQTNHELGKQNIEISKEVFNDIVKGIPSPLEISALIKESGVDYDEDILNATDNKELYNTNFKKAFNLGVFGADLGYINLYDKTGASLKYLTAIKGLADDLNVGQFFNLSMIKKMANNNGNIDTLLNLSTQSFNEMNAYLIDQGRGDIGVVMLAGGWIEALHIAIKAGQKKNDAAIIERVGEQKITLNELKLLLEAYQNDPNIGKLSEQFDELKSKYDEVTINYEYAEPEMKEVDGMLMIVDNSTSKVEMTSEEFEAIAEVVSSIRSNIIQ